MAQCLATTIALCLSLVSAVGAQLPARTHPGQDASARAGSEQRFFGSPVERRLLAPDQAFKITVRASGPRQLVVQFFAEKDHYLYRDKFQLSVLEPTGISIARVDWPRGEMKSDPFFGDTEVFERPGVAAVHLERQNDGAAILVLRVTYQGCNYVVGVCFPPLEKHTTVSLPPMRHERTGQ